MGQTTNSFQNFCLKPSAKSQILCDTHVQIKHYLQFPCHKPLSSVRGDSLHLTVQLIEIEKNKQEPHVLKDLVRPDNEQHKKLNFQITQHLY